MEINRWEPYAAPTAAELAMAKAVLLRLFAGRNQVPLSELQREASGVRYPTLVESMNELRIVQHCDGTSTFCTIGR